MATPMINRIIIDFRPVITKYSEVESAYDLYKVFPIRDIVETILSVSPDIDYSEILYYEIESRLSRHPDGENITYCVDMLDIFFEGLAKMLDELVISKVPMGIEFQHFSVDRWVTTSSLMFALYE